MSITEDFRVGDTELVFDTVKTRVKVMGEESGKLESAFGIILSSFTYEVNK